MKHFESGSAHNFEGAVRGDWRCPFVQTFPIILLSPVIMRLLEERLPFRSIIVMVQKEAAERLCAPVAAGRQAQ